MMHIVHLSLADASLTQQFCLHLPSGLVQISRLGTSGDESMLRRLAELYHQRADAVVLSRGKAFGATAALPKDGEARRLRHYCDQGSGLFSGTRLLELYEEHAWQQAVSDQAMASSTAKIALLDRPSLRQLRNTLISSAAKLSICSLYHAPSKGAEPLLHRLAQRHTGRGSAAGSARLAHGAAARAAISEADVVIGEAQDLLQLPAKLLGGKVLITSEANADLLDLAKTASAHNLYSLSISHENQPLYANEVEALCHLLPGRSEALGAGTTIGPSHLKNGDLLTRMAQLDIEVKVHKLHPERQGPVRRFAFVIHPLKKDQLFLHPTLRLMRHLPRPVTDFFERTINHLPGAHYGRIRGVVSTKNGNHAEGLIYTLFGTPKQLLAAKPEMVYRQLVSLAHDAQKHGASLIGLGAFTKIVGDAGVTVAAQSPIPVTTGNSLSAAATLWAARNACLKLGLLPFSDSQSNKVIARAMIIGASGSIGKACAKILSQTFSDIILCGKSLDKLDELKSNINKLYPDVTVTTTTDSSAYAKTSELIVIATSATDGGVLDLKTVKAGCVICDVSRPLTFDATEAATRPDVLIIESGEIDLPGNVKLDCDIGLHDSTVYACLAETAILALADRPESYTLSRDIETAKVMEIYHLARAHGATLAKIRGPNGVINDLDFRLCREHAQRSLLKDLREKGQSGIVIQASEIKTEHTRADASLRRAGLKS